MAVDLENLKYQLERFYLFYRDSLKFVKPGSQSEKYRMMAMIQYSLDSSDGLMLGQHVYIEPDEGQDDNKAGIWLNDYFIVDADTDSPYVWVARSPCLR